MIGTIIDNFHNKIINFLNIHFQQCSVLQYMRTCFKISLFILFIFMLIRIYYFKLNANEFDLIIYNNRFYYIIYCITYISCLLIIIISMFGIYEPFPKSI